MPPPRTRAPDRPTSLSPTARPWASRCSTTGSTSAPGQELLTSTHDFFVTHDALQLKADRSGASLRKIPLYEQSAAASASEIVRRVVAAVTPRTRVVALTWVHSSTGVKLPIAAIARALAPLNRGRAEADRILFCVDGVHGFGIENVRLPASAATSSRRGATSGSSGRAGPASCGAARERGST